MLLISFLLPAAASQTDMTESLHNMLVDRFVIPHGSCSRVLSRLKSASWSSDQVSLLVFLSSRSPDSGGEDRRSPERDRLPSSIDHHLQAEHPPPPSRRHHRCSCWWPIISRSQSCRARPRTPLLHAWVTLWKLQPDIFLGWSDSVYRSGDSKRRGLWRVPGSISFVWHKTKQNKTLFCSYRPKMNRVDDDETLSEGRRLSEAPSQTNEPM